MSWTYEMPIQLALWGSTPYKDVAAGHLMISPMAFWLGLPMQRQFTQGLILQILMIKGRHSSAYLNREY